MRVQKTVLSDVLAAVAGCVDRTSAADDRH